MEDKDYFSKVFADSSLCRLSVSRHKGCSPPGMGDRRENAFTKGNVYPFLGRQGKSKELSLCLLPLNCLQFKILLTLKWHYCRVAHSDPFSTILRESGAAVTIAGGGGYLGGGIDVDYFPSRMSELGSGGTGGLSSWNKSLVICTAYPPGDPFVMVSCGPVKVPSFRLSCGLLSIELRGSVPGLGSSLNTPIPPSISSVSPTPLDLWG